MFSYFSFDNVLLIIFKQALEISMPLLLTSYGVMLKVEDIVDTGNTLNCLIEHLKLKKASSVSVCTLLDKPSRRKVHFKLFGNGKFYSGFEVSCFSSHRSDFVYHYVCLWDLECQYIAFSKILI